MIISQHMKDGKAALHRHLTRTSSERWEFNLILIQYNLTHWRGGQAYEERQSQLTMDAFLSFSQRFAKVKSTRLQKALATGGPKRARNLEALSMASPEKPKKPKQPSRKRQKKAGEAAVEAGAEAAEGQETGVGNGSQGAVSCSLVSRLMINMTGRWWRG